VSTTVTIPTPNLSWRDILCFVLGVLLTLAMMYLPRLEIHVRPVDPVPTPVPPGPVPPTPEPPKPKPDWLAPAQAKPAVLEARVEKPPTVKIGGEPPVEAIKPVLPAAAPQRTPPRVVAAAPVLPSPQFYVQPQPAYYPMAPAVGVSCVPGFRGSK
jgi:hypothetical protein